MSDALKCPYTGEAMEVVLLPGPVRWTAKGGFDPAEWQDKDALAKMMRTRGGREYATRRILKCAYTGKPVTLVTSDGKLFRAEGAFSPRQLWLSKENAVYDLSVREGVAPAFPRETKVWVGEESRPQSNPAEGLGTLGDNAAEKIIELMGAKGG